MQVRRTVVAHLPSTPTLKDLRDFVRETKDLRNEASLRIEAHNGQMDAVNYSLTLEGELYRPANTRRPAPRD